MTVDELIDLCEALLDEVGFNLTVLRSGVGILEGLSDEQFLLATRFAAGERPERTNWSERDKEFAAAATPRRERRLVSLDEDELAERLAQLEELDEDTPSGPIDIGDGVTLF